jgi:hypothetical protein
MKFVKVRDLRINPNKVWKELELTSEVIKLLLPMENQLLFCQE